jgi:hypothetical protein
VSLDAIKTALPAYWEWRNIRQMHQANAVGRAQEANVDGDGLFLTAKIVEEGCIKLIDEKVLQGFSIGGKKLAKKGDTITELELIEISVVDRPANPDCRFTALGKSASAGVMLLAKPKPSEPFGQPVSHETEGDLVISAAEAGPLRKFFGRLFGKREFSDKERSQLADSGAAMPDGSFPIKNEEDLRNAIQAHGRAKNPEAAKKHIIERAHALGCTSLLPAEWERHEPTEAEKAASAAATQSDPAAVTGGTTPEDDRPPFEQLKEHLEMANLDEIFARMASRQSAQSTDMQKRGNKAAFGKAAHHLGKMMECAKSAHGHFGKAAGCMMDHVKAMKAAGVNKAAGEEHVTAAMGHMASGNAKMEEMQDHGELAQHYMGKAAGGEGESTGGGAHEITGNEVGGSSRSRGQGELTEGGVPEYDSQNPYPNKAAGYTKEIVDALVAAAAKAANAEGQLEIMKRMPATLGPKAARFAEIGKAFAPGTGAGDQPNALEALFKDVNTNPADPEQAKGAATTMIANMYRNPRIFAKSVTDPSFRGTGGVRH